MCVHAFKVATFPQKVSYSARTFPEMWEKQNRVSKSVFVKRCDTMPRRIKSQLFSDFSRFPFPENINEIARAFSRSDSMNLI